MRYLVFHGLAKRRAYNCGRKWGHYANTSTECDDNAFASRLDGLVRFGGRITTIVGISHVLITRPEADCNTIENCTT